MLLGDDVAHEVDARESVRRSQFHRSSVDHQDRSALTASDPA